MNPFRRATQFWLLAAALLAPWNALNVGGVQLVDIAIAVALTLAIACIRPGQGIWIPAWVTVGAGGILAVMLIQTFFPTDPLYLASRFVLVPYPATLADYMDEGTISRGTKWLLALAVVPILTAEFARGDRRFVDRMAKWWLAGVVVSGGVAILGLSLIHISEPTRPY